TNHAGAPPDGRMPVERPDGPGDAASELVGAHGAGPFMRREAREGDPSRGREPYRTGEDARVIAFAPERQVRHREEPRAADAPERRGGGAQPARLTRLAHQRDRLGTEDERAAAAPPRQPHAPGLARDRQARHPRPRDAAGPP